MNLNAFNLKISMIDLTVNYYAAKNILVSYSWCKKILFKCWFLFNNFDCALNYAKKLTKVITVQELNI